MNLSPRQRDILSWLHASHQLGTEQLAERFQVSPQTIRRDIHGLCEQGLARRQHGGLALLAAQHNRSFAQRSSAHSERKRRIAQAAVGLLQDEATVFLGYGTTVAAFARALPPDKPLRVVTNNLDAALALADKPAVETWLAGGRLRPADRDLMGFATLEFLQRFEAHLAVLGAGGITADGVLCEFQPEEAELSRVLLAHSQSQLLLVDGSKYRRAAPCRVATLAELDHVFTDEEAPEALQTLCARAGVAFHRCGEAQQP
ncbi:DeoR/GlpR transcriptional regulator [Ideonella sp. B7]|uniref:DeoR/GlpR family DNA-binding transcription regulator n=1 Tax=Ideonella benzenivorans TaxID=2831643 RepID=UPI001CEC9F47|nr:DeoR/GlpR family DNA-binding transcription regulator [Ideonella benzenivorans]MCA6215096.1 DeoR/GlpR transcriptional regulator [Ideonella benzenivorans]